MASQKAPDERVHHKANTMKRFSEMLRRIVKKFEDYRRYIQDVCGVSSHSNREGTASFVFQFSWVTAVCVYLRAEWSLGNFQDRIMTSLESGIGIGSHRLIRIREFGY